MTLLSLLAEPPISFLLIGLWPSPRQMWSQRWPTIAFVGLYQMALDRCVQIEGRLVGKTEGVLLPIHKGMTTDTMIQFLQNPEAFKRQQPILGIFPVGDADRDFEKHMKKEWHTGAAVEGGKAS